MLRNLGATILAGPRLCARLLTRTDTRDVAPQSACSVIPKMPSLRAFGGVWPALPSIRAFPGRGPLNVRCLVPPTQLSRVERPTTLALHLRHARHSRIPIFLALRGWNSSSFAGLLVRMLTFLRACASDRSCPCARPFCKERRPRNTRCPA
ncbi:hypothetical protein B0H15DRAFT_866456 [Mycena belliarum]|uniref:Uncharacterized protein n=1 Tax=Mycena belliarum TaxID=1033014 RepID=A0AAD6TSH8_9AGAR|nr:hypothetical protein B0H15DRAFT_866456 [Mycena belliae]